jgi:hypothetical protein
MTAQDDGPRAGSLSSAQGDWEAYNERHHHNDSREADPCRKDFFAGYAAGAKWMEEKRKYGYCDCGHRCDRCRHPVTRDEEQTWQQEALAKHKALAEERKKERQWTEEARFNEVAGVVHVVRREALEEAAKIAEKAAYDFGHRIADFIREAAERERGEP